MRAAFPDPILNRMNVFDIEMPDAQDYSKLREYLDYRQHLSRT